MCRGKNDKNSKRGREEECERERVREGGREKGGRMEGGREEGEKWWKKEKREIIALMLEIILAVLGEYWYCFRLEDGRNKWTKIRDQGSERVRKILRN